VAYVVRIATLYKKGIDPKASDTPWIQVAIKSDTFPPTNCLIEEYSGTAKIQTNPDIAEIGLGASLADAEGQFESVIARRRRDGFELYSRYEFDV
jgi:hypothetical protein